MKQVFLALLCLAWPGVLLAQQGERIAALSDADLALGEEVFQAECARCHGMGGGGGEGPSLQRATLRHAPTDDDLFEVIQLGIQGAGMPGNWRLTDEEIWQVAGYVRRSLGVVEPEPLPGDPERGREIYDTQGCEACHVVAGIGRSFGPELTLIGVQRGLSHLRQSLVDPGAEVSERYLFVRARADGKRIEGLRLNEDAFTIQLRDAQNRLHTLEKSELAELRKLPGRSLMQSYRALEPDELDDLVSYLGSLKERP